MCVCDYVDESGETLFFIFFYFSEVYYENQKSNAKRGAHSKDLEASAQKKMDDALTDMLCDKD